MRTTVLKNRLSIDSEIDAAAKYALKVMRRERKHEPIPKHGKNVPKEGEICYRGCCQFRSGYWIGIGGE